MSCARCRLAVLAAQAEHALSPGSGSVGEEGVAIFPALKFACGHPTLILRYHKTGFHASDDVSVPLRCAMLNA